MSNAFVHVELGTTDVDKAKAFYGKLFEWKLEDVPMGDGTTYTMIGVGTGTGGGMMKQMMPKVMQGVTEVMGMGWLSIIVDPTGAALGMWKPKAK